MGNGSAYKSTQLFCCKFILAKLWLHFEKWKPKAWRIVHATTAGAFIKHFPKKREQESIPIKFWTKETILQNVKSRRNEEPVSRLQSGFWVVWIRSRHFSVTA